MIYTYILSVTLILYAVLAYQGHMYAVSIYLDLHVG
jgi:hypothetical protein